MQQNAFNTIDKKDLLEAVEMNLLYLLLIQEGGWEFVAKV